MTYIIVMKGSDLVVRDGLTLKDAREQIGYYGSEYEIRNKQGKVMKNHIKKQEEG